VETVVGGHGQQPRAVRRHSSGRVDFGQVSSKRRPPVSDKISPVTFS